MAGDDNSQVNHPPGHAHWPVVEAIVTDVIAASLPTGTVLRCSVDRSESWEPWEECPVMASFSFSFDPACTRVSVELWGNYVIPPVTDMEVERLQNERDFVHSLGNDPEYVRALDLELESRFRQVQLEGLESILEWWGIGGLLESLGFDEAGEEHSLEECVWMRWNYNRNEEFPQGATELSELVMIALKTCTVNLDRAALFHGTERMTQLWSGPDSHQVRQQPRG